MIYGIYAIRDRKTGYYPPTVDQNDASAVRNFSYAINNEGIMNYSPADFDLYKVGEYDTESGLINTELGTEFLVSGVSVFTEK